MKTIPLIYKAVAEEEILVVEVVEEIHPNRHPNRHRKIQLQVTR
jgi:hypothetical protein